MTTGDGLLVRTPAYCALESPLHYVLRLSESNGYDTPAVVVQLVTGGEDWRVLARWDCTHLNEVLPSCRHLPATFTYRWPKSKHRCDLSILGKRILSRHLSASRAGICPDCIRELRYAPAWWDLKYAIACPKHHRMLVQTCGQCGKPLSHLRRGLLTCSCGASLAEGQPDDLEPANELLWLMELLRRKSEESLAASTTFQRNRPLKPDDLSLGTLCWVIETVGKVELRMEGFQKKCGAPAAIRKYLHGVAQFLHDWPNGVHPFCVRWHEFVNARGGGPRGFRSTFAWAFQGLLHSGASKRNDILFIMDEVLKYAPYGWSESVPDVRAMDLKRLSRGERPYCDLRRASELSGIPPHTLVRLIRRKAVPYRVQYRANRPVYEIKVEIARELTLKYSPALYQRPSAKFLGITHSLYRTLRQRGMLRKVRPTMMPRSIALQDLKDFKQGLIAKARRATKARGLVSLDALRRKKCPVLAVAQILEAVMQDSIPCFRTGATPKRIDNLAVRMTDVEPIISASAPRPPTAREVRAQYNLSAHEVQALAHHLSRSTADFKRIHIRKLEEGTLDSFMSRYTGLTAYATRQGVNYRAALGHLRRSNSELLGIRTGARSKRFAYFVPRRSENELVRKAA